MQWFDVDKDGLSQLLDRRGRHRVLLEPASNSFDEDVTKVTIDLRPVDGRRGAFNYSIEDDGEGWRNLSHAWTMFAESYKKADVKKRGRFNLGDKLFLAVCESASIVTTSGSVTFDANGRRQSKRKIERGSRFEAVVLMTKPEIDKGLALLRTMLIPEGVEVTLNGEQLKPRTPVHAFDTKLPTEFQGSDGGWRSTARKTSVRLYDPQPGEKAHIYEMGIPVVDHDGRWHVDVLQKVPLNTDRDNITPSYLRQLREEVLNNSHQLLDTEDANAVWVRDAVPHATREALETVLDKRFGEKRVVADPSDPEANKLAAAAGYTVIAPRSFSRDEWSNIKSHELVKPAGQVTPSNSSVQLSNVGKPPESIDRWTDGMQRVATYAMRVAKSLLGCEVTVAFYKLPLTEAWAACYGSRHLSFNISRLGQAWFENPDEIKVDALLIHEFAHHRVSDHLDHAYHEECCRLGALIKQKADELHFKAEDETIAELIQMLRESSGTVPPLPEVSEA